VPSREKVRVFSLERQASAVLGPGGQYLLRLVGDTTVEIYEPFVLQRAVAKVATPCRPERFEFSRDGSRVAASLSDASIMVWDTTPWRVQLSEQLSRAVPTDLASLWADLAKDATTGLRAARLLSASGDRAVALLGEKIATKTAPDEAGIKRRIADLDSPVFAKRERAEQELRDLSVQTEEQLREALRADPSLEMRRRLGKLLKAIETRSLTTAENRELRAVQALEWMDCDSARALLAKWSRGEPTATLTKAAKKVSKR
jgi:hypothetical protein